MTQRVELIPPAPPVSRLEVLVKAEAGEVEMLFLQDGKLGIAFKVPRNAARGLALTIFDALAEREGGK